MEIIGKVLFVTVLTFSLMSGGVSAAISTEQLSTENQEVNRAFAPVEHYTLKLYEDIKLKTVDFYGFHRIDPSSTGKVSIRGEAFTANNYFTGKKVGTVIVEVWDTYDDWYGTPPKLVKKIYFDVIP
ncbi:hypothetical protein QJ48_26380 [Paenibacillus sp. A3]|uniref:hypothetical protein n=1 Tax=Paenibacillus sp. A3 TaxID=1337054 RepID=UPI0006D59BF7|nr:hypothetical protein [Paenibacillus sp. A3]KPV56706.1 hypothetical protein QJ48_26380 [Paenibacillus sp. A3]